MRGDGGGSVIVTQQRDSPEWHILKQKVNAKRNGCDTYGDWQRSLPPRHSLNFLPDFPAARIGVCPLLQITAFAVPTTLRRTHPFSALKCVIRALSVTEEASLRSGRRMWMSP